LETKNWTTPAELPKQTKSAIELWVAGILHDGPIPFGLEEATQLTELMQYAYVSHREKKQIDIPVRKTT